MTGMEVVFHTILVEPERWTERRVFRPLVDLLPDIHRRGFHALEVYEPHLGVENVSPDIRESFKANSLRPLILSSYLNLNPAVTSDQELEKAGAVLLERCRFYGFEKIRLFAGPKMSPLDRAGVEIFIQRVRSMAQRLSGIEILLETHDGSLADDFQTMVSVMEGISSLNVGLLFQPTHFKDPALTWKQFTAQKPWIRHLHLQDRNADLTFARLGRGLVPWARILRSLPPQAGVTLEFVPAGICPTKDFNLDQVLAEANDEKESLIKLIG
jgi:sugar phosphate isomerase/epimerase